MNDLLIAVTSRAVGSYLETSNDSVFKDNKNGKDLVCCGQCYSFRSKQKKFNDINNIKNGLVNNSFAMVYHDLSISSRTTVNDIGRETNLFKYGANGSITSMMGQLLKYKVKEFVNNPNGTFSYRRMNECITNLAFSNFLGPSSIIPVGFNSNGDNDSYITRFHVYSVAFKFPIFITFVSYNNLCKLTIATDNGYVKNPKQLRQCWFDEWIKYAASADV